MQKAKRWGSPHDREARLREITAALASARQSGTTSKIVLAQLIELLSADTGALFLLDDDGVTLRGAHGVWDWTRSSFRVRLDLWPNVQKALATGKATRIRREDAQGLERDWFESDGIESCICAPMMAGEHAVGMLFVDFMGRRSKPSTGDLRLAEEAADAWVESMANPKRSGPGLATTTPESRRIGELMDRDPMLMDARVRVEVAKRMLAASPSRHALVVNDGELLGVLTESSLHSARSDEPVAAVTQTSFSLVPVTAPADAVAQTMMETGADCLPVLLDDEVVGTITRRELRKAGYLPGERGVDACLACGNTHDLGAAAEGAMVFCSSCLAAPTQDSLEALYNTLGGSG